MAYHVGPPGIMLDPAPPSPKGVHLEYVHPFTDANPYRYSSNNSINRIDPSGFKDVKTGVKTCQAYQAGGWFRGWFPFHPFIKIGNTGWGYYEQNLNPIGSGYVNATDAQTYPELANPKLGQWYSVCNEIVVDDCCYNIAAFVAGAMAEIARWTANPGTYCAIGQNCGDFVGTVESAAYRAGDNGKCADVPIPQQPGGPISTRPTRVKCKPPGCV